MRTVRISDRVHYIGVNDRTTTKFEGMWPLPLGVSYNSYIVEGSEKTAIIDGVSRYTGASITVPDLRGGAALVIAALAAEGFTTVDNIKYVERGYEDFHIKLQGLGAQIELVETDKEIQKFRLKVG